MKTLLVVVPLLVLSGCIIPLSPKIEGNWKAVPVADDQTLEYRVYLPPQYHTQPHRQFPLLVYFHGGGGNHRSWGSEGGLGERMIERMAAEEFGPFVVVAPSVGRFDVIAGASERILFEQILPDVQAAYRVNGRTVAFGHSMGGLSALMLAMRHPGVFDAVAAASPFAYDISPFDSDEVLERFEQKYGRSFFVNRWQSGIAGKFATREEFDSYSPFGQVRRAKGPLPFRLFITTGTEDPMGLYEQNLLLHRELSARAIPHEFLVQEGVAHSTLREPRLYQWLDEQAGDAVTGAAGGR